MVAWNRLRGPLLGTALVLLAGIPIVAHATHERQEEKAKVAHLEELMKGLQPLAPKAREGRRVFINGDPIFFRMQTSTESVAKALDAVDADCDSGDPARMLGIPSGYERGAHQPHLSLTKRLRQDGDGIAATFCIFHQGDGHDEGTAQTRYTFAERGDDHRVSLFTISTEKQTDLYSVFPLEGDAPGGDFPNIPRPRDSRRLFAATIEDDPYAVRIYESKKPMAESVTQYDADMALAGWQRSEAVAKAMPNARFYTRGDERFVASFEAADDASRISLAPFQK
jgi:hypothetical protein